MNFHIKYLIHLTALFLLSSPLWAGSKNEYSINGRIIPEIIAEINGVKISSDFLINELKIWKMMAERNRKPTTPKEEEDFFRRKIDEAIGHELLFQQSRKLKIRIPPETIQKEIENFAKKFSSRELFLSSLAFQRLNIETLTTKIEKQLIEEAFLRKKIAPFVDVPDSQVKAYYQKHKNKYKTETKYRVSHIFIATVTPGEGREPSDSRDRRKARRIIQSINQEARAKITAIHAQLKKGKNFTTLCKDKSEDEATRERGGDMGEIKLSETIFSLASVIDELKIGQISGVVESPYGYHILKLMDKIADKQLSFQDVQSDILNIILKKQLEKKRLEYLFQLKQAAEIKIFL